MFSFFAKRLGKRDASSVARIFLEFIVEKDIDPREAVLNAEPIFNLVVDDSHYRDYKMTNQEIKVMLQQAIYWLQHHESAVYRLNDFRITQRENRKNNPHLHISYKREVMDSLFEFIKDQPLIDSIKWKGK